MSDLDAKMPNEATLAEAKKSGHLHDRPTEEGLYLALLTAASLCADAGMTKPKFLAISRRVWNHELRRRRARYLRQAMQELTESRRPQ